MPARGHRHVVRAVPSELRRFVRSTIRPMLGGGRGRILVAVAAGWYLSFGVRLVYPAILPSLRAGFDLDLTTAGALVSVLWMAYALGQLPGGVLCDRLGDRRVLLSSTAGSAVLIGLVAVAWNAPMLFAATAAFGLATALYGPARFTILADVFGDRAGTAVGLTLSAGELGNVTLPVIAGVLASVVSWRLGLGLALPLFALVAVGMWAVLPADQPRGRDRDGSGEPLAIRSVLAAVSRRSVLALAGIQLIALITWQGFTAFYPTYLVLEKGFRPATAAALFGAFFAVGIVVQTGAGVALDRVGARRSLPATLLPPAVAIAALTAVDGPVGVLAATVGAGLLLGVTAIVQPSLVASLPDEIQATGLGLVRTVFMFVGAASPTVVGVLADAGRFDLAFRLLGLVAALGVLLIPFLERASGTAVAVEG